MLDPFRSDQKERTLKVQSRIPFSQNLPSSRIFGCSFFAYMAILAALLLSTSAFAQETANPETKEDLSQLKVEAGKMSAMAPFLIQKDEEPEYTREFYRVQWRANDPIDLYVILPATDEKVPATLFLYGFPSETDRFRNDEFCKQVTKRGYAAVGFVSALTGHRFHDRSVNDWFVSELPSALVMTTHDVQMILNYLETRSDIDTSRTGMLGQGSGATIAALAASVDPRLKRVELMDPWGDWPEWLANSRLILADERPSLTTKAFIDSLAGLDPVKVLPNLEPSRIILQDVLYDRDTPPAAKEALEKAMPKGVDIRKYATPEEFQAKALTNGALLDWLQPPLSGKGKNAAGPSEKAKQRPVGSTEVPK